MVVEHEGDSDTTNNAATRYFDADDVIDANLYLVGGVSFDPTSESGIDECDPVEIVVTAGCSGSLLESASVQAALYQRISYVDPNTGIPGIILSYISSISKDVYFTPDAFESGSQFSAESDITFEWTPLNPGNYEIGFTISKAGHVELGAAREDNSVTVLYTVNAAAELTDGFAITDTATTPSSPILAGSEFMVSAEIENTGDLDYDGIVARLYLGDPRNDDAVALLGGTTIAQLDQGCTTTLSIDCTLDEIGEHTLLLGVVPQGMSGNKYNYQWAEIPVEIIEDVLPDLTLAQDSDFTVAAEAIQGDVIDLQALATNSGLTSVDHAYKLEILDGSPQSDNAKVLAEAIVNGSTA